jgi:hypothetical protein
MRLEHGVAFCGGGCRGRIACKKMRVRHVTVYVFVTEVMAKHCPYHKITLGLKYDLDEVELNVESQYLETGVRA